MIGGKFNIELDGQTREMAANFGFVEMVEQMVINKPIVQLLDEAINGRMKLTDLVNVIHIALKANKDTRLTRDAIGSEIIRVGSTKFMQTYIELLTYAITGDVELKVDDASDKKK